MKPGTVEYFVRTTRDFIGAGENQREVYYAELWLKIRGYDNEGTFDPETINQGLIEKLQQENMRILIGNPNLRRRESRALEQLPVSEKPEEPEKTE